MKVLPPVRYRLIGLPGRAETEVKEDKWSRWLKDERWPDWRDPLDREPRLRPDEQLQLSCIAERLTMVGRTPGRLALTDQRLIFEPVIQPIWFPLSVEMRRDGLRVSRSGLLSRFLHLRGLDPAVAPTYLHVDDIKISRGRKVAWFRVHDAEEWARALPNP